MTNQMVLDKKGPKPIAIGMLMAIIVSTCTLSTLKHHGANHDES